MLVSKNQFLLIQLPIFISVFLIIIIIGWTNCQIPPPMPPECENVTVSEVDVGNVIFKDFAGTWQRPRLNARHSLELNISLSLAAINDVLEKYRIIRITAYLALRWFDEFHVWNTTFPLYCVPYIVVQANDVWRPDVAQMNSQSKYSLMDMPGEKIRLHSNGFTTYSPGGTFEAFCDFDFTLFPFDTQKCSIQLESWRYTRDFVKFSLLHRFSTKMKLYQFHENDQWQVVDTRQQIIDQEYTYKELRFDRVEFTVWIKRKSAYYVLNIIAPSVIISIAQISTFSINARETVKMELSFTCLLAYSVFQLQVVDNMPRSSDRVPYLSIYIDLQMFYIALSMLGQGFMFLVLSQADDAYPDEAQQDVPRWLYRITLIFGKLFHVVGAPRKSALDDRHKTTNKKNDKNDKNGDIDMQQHVNLTSDSITTAEKGGDEATKQKLMSSDNDEPVSDEFKRNNKKRQRQSNDIPDHGTVLKMRYRWIYMAAVINRLTFAFYMVCITVTPFAIFVYACGVKTCQ